MRLSRARMFTVTALLATVAGVVLVASPAAAAVPNAFAFAFMDNPSPGVGYAMDPAHQSGTFASTCGKSTVTQFATGGYEVTFPCAGRARQGIVHVTAVDASGRYCAPGKWTANGGIDEIVDVFCFDPTGSPADATFTILYTTSSGPPTGGQHAYLFADPSGVLHASYNGSGAANAVSPLGVGIYQVTLPGIAPGGYAGDLQATAVNTTARRCKVGNWSISLSGTDYGLLVFCFDATGTFADSQFTLSYHDQRSVSGALSPPRRFAYVFDTPGAPPATNFNSVGGSNTVTPAGVGEDLVVFGKVGVKATHMQVTTYGDDPGYCQLSRLWVLLGSDAYVKTVICFDGRGGLLARPYFATFTTNACVDRGRWETRGRVFRVLSTVRC
jgi:hypothetical protein